MSAAGSATGMPRISGLTVTKADPALSQSEVLTLLELHDDPFAARIFERAAVITRSLSLRSGTLARTLQGRTPWTEEQLFDGAVEAVERLVVDPAEIGTVVTASLYSLGGPTLAHRLVEHFGMDAATDKYHIVGVGCASAVPLVRFVVSSLNAHPTKKGLIVAAESMSGLMMPAAPGDERAKTVGAAIFGDGCAAAVVEHGSGGPAIMASKVHQIQGTLGSVRIQVSDQDSYLHLERDLPDVAVAGLPELIDEFLETAGLTRERVDHWIVHPGGRRILDRVSEVLALTSDQLRVSYDVLATRGNVGTPSIFYVLDATINRRRPRSGERGLLVTVGPGVTIGLMLLVF